MSFSHCDPSSATKAETCDDDDACICGCSDSDDCGVINPRRRGGLNLLGLGSGRRSFPKVECTCDYEKKYAPDPEYTEMGPEARVWKVYLDVCTRLDEEKFEERNDSLKVVIVFGSLFTLAVATLVSHTSQWLRPDYTRSMMLLLNELLELERAVASGLPIHDIPSTDLTFTPKSSHVWANGLWFTSFTLSLMAAVFAMTVQKWLREAIYIPSGSPRDRARIRQYRYTSFEKWHVQEIVDALPIVLHISVGLFVVGLVVYAASLEDLVGNIFAGFVGVGVVVWMGSMLGSLVSSLFSTFSLSGAYNGQPEQVPSADLYPDLEKSNE